MYKNKKYGVRKSIRFDDDMYRAISILASESGRSFSKEVKILILLSTSNGINSTLPVSFIRGDRKLLHDVLILYSQSSNNLNQISYNLNLFRNFSWLNLSSDELSNKFDEVSNKLDEVNGSFDAYQSVLYSLVSRVKSNHRKR